MNKSYAIFDMDGTLIDSMTVWQGLAGEYLAAKGISAPSSELLQEIETMTMSESAALFSRLFPALGSPVQVEAEMNRRMEDHYRQDIPLKPGVRSYLQKLYTQGVRMCVASATAAPLMEACLTRLGIRDYFQFLLSCEELHASKRQPDIYLEAARRLGAVPGDTAVFEDALYAVNTAKAANFFVVGVYEQTLSYEWEAVCSLADETIQFSCV